MKRDNLNKRKSRAQRGRIPRNRILFILAGILFIIVLTVGFRFIGAQNDLQNTAEWAMALRQAPLEDKGANYLIYGVYTKEGELRMDEIFLLNYYPGAVYPHIIFIPGELLLNRRAEQQNGTPSPSPEQAAEIDELTEERNTYFIPANLYAEGGARLLISQLSYFLGVPIHYYLGIDYGGIPVMVDYLGSITYRGDVLRGDDYYGYFLRGEADEKPLQRALRRMQMLDLLVEAVGEKRGLFSKSRSLRKAAPYLDTNISRREMDVLYPSLAPLFSGKESEITVLPGAWHRRIDGEYYYKVERGLLSYLMANLGKDFILPRELVTVEVLNGSGLAGIASKAAVMLQEHGFHVVNVDNADSFDYARTHVISRQAEMGPAKEVAEIMGAELLKEEVPGFPAMVTVIVGRNFLPDQELTN